MTPTLAFVQPAAGLAYVLNGVYLLLWLGLLIHCLRKKRFFPVFGPGTGTKLFWLASFAFLNPVLTFYYLIFGVVASPSVRASAARSLGVVVLVVLTAGLFHAPIGLPGSEPRVLERQAGSGEVGTDDSTEGDSEPDTGEDTGEDTVALSVHLGAGQFGIRSEKSLSQWAPDTATFSGATILILNQSDHPLMRRAGAKLQRALFAQPGVESVAYYPEGRFPEPGRPAPDVVIALELLEISSLSLPLSRHTSARVRCTAGNSTLFQYLSSDPSVRSTATVKFRVTADVTLDPGVHLRIESAAARFGLEAEKVAETLAEALTRDFEAMAAAHGRTPSLPDGFRGPYRPAPDPASLGLPRGDALFSGPGLLTHNQTVWRFSDPRTTSEVLDELERKLTDRGWTRLEVSGERQRLLKNDRLRLSLYRGESPGPRPGTAVLAGATAEPSPPQPFYVQYTEHLGRAEIEAALETLLATEAPLDALVMFGPLYTDAQRKRFRARLDRLRPATPGAYLKLAKVRIDGNEPRRAAESLRLAAALSRCGGEPPLDRGKARALARKLGDEGVLDARPDPRICRRLGFTELNQEKAATVVQEVRVNQPLFFYRQGDRGELVTMMVKTRPGADRKTELYYRVVNHGTDSAWSAQSSQMPIDAGALRPPLGDRTATLSAEPEKGGAFRIRLILD